MAYIHIYSKIYLLGRKFHKFFNSVGRKSHGISCRAMKHRFYIATNLRNYMVIISLSDGNGKLIPEPIYVSIWDPIWEPM